MEHRSSAGVSVAPPARRAPVGSPSLRPSLPCTGKQKRGERLSSSPRLVWVQEERASVLEFDVHMTGIELGTGARIAGRLQKGTQTKRGLRTRDRPVSQGASVSSPSSSAACPKRSRNKGMNNRNKGMDSRNKGMDNRNKTMDNRNKGMDNRNNGMDNRNKTMDNRNKGYG